MSKENVGVNLEERPVSDCIMCNLEARGTMTPEAQQFTADLLADMPLDRIPGVPCWNCAGLGTIGGPNWKHRYLDELSRLMTLASQQ